MGTTINRPAANWISATGASQAITDLLRATAQLFERTQPYAPARTAHLWWLAVVLAAGCGVRLWGLGAVGLHGDEETMAMAVRHILIDGQPTLPSGMFYPRGLTQLYLMALSVGIFGESEWALRLPSALCGSALIALAYVVGRRFLRPQWSVAFAATMAFLPDLILYSQTARMYIFMVTSIMAALACIFAWERSGHAGWLAGAVAAFIFGLDFQLLTVAAVFVLLLPGLLQGDSRKLFFGGVAVLLVGVAYLIVDALTSAQYPVPPPEFASGLGAPMGTRVRTLPQFALPADILLGLGGMIIAGCAVRIASSARTRPAGLGSALLLLAGAALQLALFYHLAALFYIAGIAVALRHAGSRPVLPMVLLLIAAVGLAAVHVALLASSYSTIIKLIGAMVGTPSVWPYVRIAQLSEFAALLTLGLLIWGLYLYVQRKRVPDYWLLAVLGAFLPVFALGLFAWNVPTRYTAMALMPLLLCAFAFAQHCTDRLLAALPRLPASLKSTSVAAALTAVCVVNPPRAAAFIQGGYGMHPDHKGAAQFMQSQQLTANDIILAEDVLQQTYYMGEVDYWLIGKQVARKFVKSAGDSVVDFYTGTPVIATAAMLDELLQKHQNQRIFVVGSGEDQRDGRRTVRGDDLHQALLSDRFETIYVGRDGRTQVLRAVPGKVQPSVTTSIESEADEKELVQEAAAAESAVSNEASPAKPSPAEPNH